MYLCRVCKKKKGNREIHPRCVELKTIAYLPKKRLAWQRWWDKKGREINTERARSYRATKNGAEAVRRAVIAYEARHPERRRAWMKAQKIKLRPCQKCGSQKNIHRHHPNIENPLEVVFLCARCHVAEHRKVVSSEPSIHS